MRLQFARLVDPPSSRSVYFSLGQVVNGHLIENLLKVSQKVEGQCLNSMNKRRGVVQRTESLIPSFVPVGCGLGIKSSFVIEVRKRPSCGQNFRDLINNDWLLNLRN